MAKCWKEEYSWYLLPNQMGCFGDTHEKIALKQICRALMRDCIGHADSQQIACLENGGGCSASLASLLLGNEEKNLFRCSFLTLLVTFPIIMQILCPAILKAVDGAIDSTINAYVNQIKVSLDEPC